MTEYAIEAVGLSKKFLMATERRTSLKERLVRGKSPAPKTFWALKDATFSVPRGSSLGIIGHNGSGKSTALKVLTGIYRPTSGTVAVNGSVSALLEVGAGFHPELTGRENIRLNATILGFTNREVDRFMDQIIEFADIGDHIDAPLKHYSSGMHVRLGFAVAVMVRPEILIVDEVIAVGDEEFQRRCYDYLYGLRRSGTSLIVVSHGLGQINDLCDEALWLAGGVTQMLGPARQVTKAYLDSVNAKEAARGAVHMDGVEGSQDRRGTGQVRVLGVGFFGPGGDIAPMAAAGGPLTIRISYSADVTTEGVAVEVIIENSSGLAVVVLTSAAEQTWTFPRGTGMVELAISELLLAPGMYTLKTVVSAEASVLDADDVGAPFSVRSVGVPTAGIFRQPATWHRVQVDVSGTVPDTVHAAGMSGPASP